MLGFRTVAIAAVLTLLAGVLACGGDDNAGTPVPTASPTSGATATPAFEQKTPVVEATPGGGSPTAQLTARPQPTPAAEGTPALEPIDPVAFLSAFATKTINYEDCQFSPATVVTDCGARGKYAVNPPLSGQDVTCRIGIVDDKPVLISCTSQQPLTTKYYEIKG